MGKKRRAKYREETKRLLREGLSAQPAWLLEKLGLQEYILTPTPPSLGTPDHSSQPKAVTSNRGATTEPAVAPPIPTPLPPDKIQTTSSVSVANDRRDEVCIGRHRLPIHLIQRRGRNNI